MSEVKAKKVDFKFEDGKLFINVDPNQDGQPLLTVFVDASELPDEVISAFKKD